MATDPVVMPPMSAAQTDAWHVLFDLHDRVPRGWTLVGGQMAHLHCTERGARPIRPTEDADTVLDVRANPLMLATFTQSLLDLGFEPHTSGDGLQHRWTRGRTQVDVLLPDGIPQRLATKVGAGGGPTLATPGGTQALNRSEAVTVTVAGRTGTVLRPNLVGALIVKAAAHTLPEGAAKGRHRTDFTVLAGLVDRSDFADATLTKGEKRKLTDMVAACRRDVTARSRPGAEIGLTRLERAAGIA